MRSRSFFSLRILIAVAVCGAAAFLPQVSAFASYAQIQGSGSSWSSVIVQRWIANVASSGMRVVYTPNGSSQGRKDFANSVTDFGISEIPYQGIDPVSHTADRSGRPYAYLPIVAGGTAFTYHVEVAGRLVRNLRLSGPTIAKIFTGKITNWNNPAITRDNNGHKLPSIPLTPVVRSDGSGTTAQFTRWLDTQYHSQWRGYAHMGMTSQFPRSGRMVGASGSDQVMNSISSSAGKGYIGYVEYSYPMNAHYPVVKVLNRNGYFVEPTQYNTAVALTRAQINQNKHSQMYLTQILNGVYNNSDPRAYPLSSYSYMIIPTSPRDRQMTPSKRQTLSDFMFYSLCQGQSLAGNYGYSPLPLNLVKAGFSQLTKLHARNSKGRNVSHCHNPTFVPGNLAANRLAQIAPMPASCDRVGKGPCGFATGTGVPSTNRNQPGGAAGAGGAGAGGAGSGALATGANGSANGLAGGVGPNGSAAGAGGAAAIDPTTGLPVGSSTATGINSSSLTPTELAAQRQDDSGVFGWVAALELLGLVLLPGLYVAAMRRRAAMKGSSL